MSKITKPAILQSVMMFAVALPLLWIPSFPDPSVPFVAAFGGVIVLIALWMEELGEEDEYETIADVRKSKRVSKIGRKLLMFGIVIEIMVGFGIAAKDIKEFSENSRLNAPINSVSAVLGLKISGASGSYFSPGMGIFVPPEPDVGYGQARITFFEGTNIFKQVFNLVSDGENIRWLGPMLVDLTATNGNGGVIAYFREDDLSEIGFLSTNKTGFGKTDGAKVGVFNNIGSVVISLPPMGTNVVVISGKILVKVNSSRWEFPIPPQKPYMGMITSEIITNSNGERAAKVFPVRVADWAVPPRFPERLYDGK